MKKTKKLKIENTHKHFKMSQNILKILSSIGIGEINIYCKFQVSTVIELQQIKKIAT